MITFPANFLPKPQLFFIAEHNISKKFPMLDIYPYLCKGLWIAQACNGDTKEIYVVSLIIGLLIINECFTTYYQACCFALVKCFTRNEV